MKENVRVTQMPGSEEFLYLCGGKQRLIDASRLTCATGPTRGAGPGPRSLARARRSGAGTPALRATATAGC